MPEEVYAIGALITFLASVAGIWSAWRRRQIMRRLLKSLTEEQRRALGLDPSEVAGAEDQRRIVGPKSSSP
jgi:uncharacterized protein YjiS (DUF1127 family)